jgi:hypothetical protein
MKRLAGLIVLASLGACAYPHTQIEQGADNGLLIFSSATADTRIIVDGRVAGSAGSFQSKNALAVRPGTHRVVLKRGTTILLDKKYYVDAGAKVVVQND